MIRFLIKEFLSILILRKYLLQKNQVFFLEKKNYDVTTCNNGQDAIDLYKETAFDVVFLDENMPGLSGLETLAKIKNIYPDIPVIMVTKSEEESIMEDAIGAKIADYLIKPVNPKQLLLSIKKNLDNKRLISEKTNSAYQHSLSDQQTIDKRYSLRLRHPLDFLHRERSMCHRHKK